MKYCNSCRSFRTDLKCAGHALQIFIVSLFILAGMFAFGFAIVSLLVFMIIEEYIWQMWALVLLCAYYIIYKLEC